MPGRTTPRSEPEPADALSAAGSAEVSSGSRARSAWWPVAALCALLIAFAATVMSVGHVTFLRADAKGAYLQATPRLQAIEGITAPVPTATPDPASFAQQIEIILPPPPPPPAPKGGGKKKGSGISPGTGGYSYVQWCDAGGGAISSATTLQGLLAAANAERAAWGFGALSWDSSLANLAQDWSNTMAAGYNPAKPAGPNFTHRGGVPENIAVSWNRTGSGDPAPYSQSSAIKSAHLKWMTSPGHCKNILKPSYTRMGAGVATTYDGSTVYTTVNFG